MSRSRLLAGALVIASLAACGGAGAQDAAPNTLTEEERRQGFVLLFDGRSLDAWRGFRRADLPAGWKAVDGTLHFEPGGEGGDLITREAFGDFDLRLRWRISEGGNSGIMYRVSEEARRTYESGPEMQVLDDARHPDGEDPKTSAGSAYGLYAPARDVVRPAGEWNEVRIVARGARVEHWLNGVKVLEYELGSPDWRERVEGTKFAEWPEFGMSDVGHIALQDHGDPVWYRDLRIRRLDG